MGQLETKPPEIDHDDLYYTDMGVGEILRRTRLHYSQSLDDIERALRIRSSQIQAIEDGRIDLLPGRVYAIGFVRSYSEYLGLDGDRMVKLFKRQSAGKSNAPTLDFPVPASDSKLPPVWLLSVCLTAALVILVGWWLVQSRDRTAVTEVTDLAEHQETMAANAKPARHEDEPYGPPAPVPAATQGAQPAVTDSATAPATTTTATATPPAAEPAEPAQQGIILNVMQNTWVEIRDKEGKALVSRVLKSGDSYFVPDRPDLTMSLGNAAGIQVEVDGQPLGSLGTLGQVLRNIPLDIAFLKQHYAPAQGNNGLAQPQQQPTATKPAQAQPAQDAVTE